MGNQLAPASKPGAEQSGELVNVVVKETLGGGRLLKSLLCLHDNGGLVVVKVFYKRKDTASLAPYKQQLEFIRASLLGLPCPHVWPMQLWWETPNAAYMMRQHFFANLYDRLSTRPFLTHLEKRWITFQLLHGLSQAHAHGVCHGDIKCENVMVTSWNWLFITDFASYKPTYLPADNPADFSFYFDTGSRRRCYLAPERFFEGSAAAINSAAPLTPEMDVFSLGCVIAELWLDGRAFFDLSRLLAFRRGEYEPAPALAGVAPDMAELIMHMIQPHPGERWSADHYLTSWPRQLFPRHFADVLHPFFHSLLHLDTDARVAAMAAHYDELAAAVLGGSSDGPAAGWAAAALAAPLQADVLRSAGPPAGGLQPAHAAASAAAGAGGQPAAAAAAPGAGPRGAAIAGIVPGAGAAAGTELLAEVSSLLADVGSAQRRALGAHRPAASSAAVGDDCGDDDGICIDDAAPDSGPGSLLAERDGAGAGGAGGRPAAAAAAAVPQQQLPPRPAPHQQQQQQQQQPQAGETEWWEHQIRGADQQWVAHTPPSSSGRDDVGLPPGGGWTWAGEWQLQPAASAAAEAAAGAAAAGGWQYAAAPDSSWSAAASDTASCRRRRWVRQRVCSAPDSAAAAAPAQQQALQPGASAGQDTGMVLLSVLLCTLLRGSKLQESRRTAILLLFRSALHCDDDVRLQTIVPYLLTQTADAHAGIRTLALRCVVQITASLSRLPPADAKVYHDYLLPCLSLLPHDQEESVRVAYALAVAHLAAAAHEHLLGMQFASASSGGGGGAASHDGGAAQPLPRHSSSGSLGGKAGDALGAGGADAAAAPVEAAPGGSAADEAAAAAAGQPGTPPATPTLSAAAAAAAAAAGEPLLPLVRYDAEAAAVRSSVEKVLLELVCGARSSADIKRALLSHSHQLGLFFGRRGINDVLLPLLITCLNAGEWQLRGSFFGAVAAVGPHTGRHSLDVWLLPCLEQALVDSEPAVVSDAVRCLASVCGHLRKRSLLAACRKVCPLLRHHAAAVRQAAVAFIAAAGRALPPADVYTQLAIMAAEQLQQQPLMLTDEEHLAACLHPSGGGGPHAPHQLQRSATAAASSAQRPGSRDSSRGSGLAGQLQPPPRRATAGDALAGAGGQQGSLGSLLTRPPGAALQHSMSEHPSSSRGSSVSGTGSGALRGVVLPSTPRGLTEELNLDGSQLLLRPSAPLYVLDLDPAALSGVGCPSAQQQQLLQVPSPAAAPEGGQPALAGLGSALAAPAAGQARRRSSRCGYRAHGFGPPARSAAAPAAGPAGAQGARAQRSTVVPSGLLAPAAPGGPAAAAAAAGAPAAAPGAFWPGPGASSLLTGFNTSLGVAHGGLVVGPTAAGSGAGLRPRPKSSHTAAIESIACRQAVLQERYNALAEALARDPSSLEAGDRQQMDRLAATLHRLNTKPGADVRCPAAVLTYRMAAITSRAGPAGPSGAAGGDPGVYDAVSAALTTGIGHHLPGSGGDAAAGPSWRPKGVLASHLQEHRAAVNCLASSANGALLLSGSDDETVKVWDVRRLERDVSFASRLTYAGQSGRITALCGVLDGASVASGSGSGSLHVWRVEYATKPGSWVPDKYRGITALRQVSPGEGAILQVLPWGGHPALLLYSTQRGGVHCCDLRCASDAWHAPAAPSLGLVQQLVADPSGQHWLAQGTSRGWVCLWDVRFLLCVNSWQHPQRCGITAMAAAAAAPPRLGLSAARLPHPGVPLLYIAAGLQEVGLWDVLDGQVHQVLRVLSREESQLGTAPPPAALQPPLPPAALGSGGIAAAGLGAGARPGSVAGAPGGSGLQQQQHGIDVNHLASEASTQLAVDLINSPQARLSGMTALLPLPSGTLLTGGADRCVRLWEPSWPERSYVVAGPVWPDGTAVIEPNTNKLQVPSHVYRYSQHMTGGVPVVEERCVGDGPRLVTPDSSPDLGSKLRMHDLVHADGITQLLAVEGTSRLLASASRDGCIKVWK